MKTEEIISKVRVVVNEFVGSRSDSFSIETDYILEEFVINAMSQLASMPGFDGQASVMEDDSHISYATRPDGNIYATIKPADDTLQIVSVWLEGWNYPVQEFLPATGSRFLAQYSFAPGIGSGENQPSVFLGQGGEIIAHSVKKEGKYNVKYISKPNPDENGNISFPVKYNEALVYMTAGLYLQSINEHENAKASFDTLSSIIQSINLK